MLSVFGNGVRDDNYDDDDSSGGENRLIGSLGSISCERFEYLWRMITFLDCVCMSCSVMHGIVKVCTELIR